MTDLGFECVEFGGVDFGERAEEDSPSVQTERGAQSSPGVSRG
ncbi:hypothetical protein [Kibdelosporangium philippinense]